MRISEILRQTGHRPWELPREPWRYYQEWNDAVFLHWRVEPAELRKHLPAELEIDLIDSEPWVSLVAFSMEKIRPRYLPAFPPISNFSEINVRAYVRHSGKPGVYFLSIEGGKRVSCFLAKTLSGLLYRYSEMKRGNGTYRSLNPGNGDRTDLEYETGKPTKEKTGLDLWLTERYALFQNTKNGIIEYETHHVEWPIHEIKLKKTDITFPAFTNLFSGPPEKSHYSPGVQVIAWGAKFGRRAES